MSPRLPKKRPPEGPAGAGLERERGIAVEPKADGGNRPEAGDYNVSRAGGSLGGNEKASAPGTIDGAACCRIITAMAAWPARLTL